MNLFESPDLPAEFTTVLLNTDKVRIEKIVSCGNVTEWYDQAEGEWVCVLDGEGELTFEDEVITLFKGEYVYIPPHKRHKVSRTTNPCVWLCVFDK